MSKGQLQWYHHLNIDLFARVLSRSIFHPAIVLIFYLCIAAMHKHREPVAFYTLYWATFLAIAEILVWLNHRLSYSYSYGYSYGYSFGFGFGSQKWTWDWDDQVIIITGGARGLGRVLADSLVRRGAKVAILDVCAADGEAADLAETGPGDLLWQVCDVASLEQVQAAVDAVVDKFGRPTVLVNNAAAMLHGRPLLLQHPSSPSVLSPDQAAKTFQVNTLGHLNLLHVCLPHLLRSSADADADAGAGAGAGYIVTISSILAHLAPAHLSDYAASKAAVSTIHHTLEHELLLLSSSPPAKSSVQLHTLLVETGQLDTALFADKVTHLPWYAHFFAPMLDAKDVADAIVHTVSRGESGVLRMPLYASLVGAGWYAVLPGSIKRLARWLSGIDAAVPFPSPSPSPSPSSSSSHPTTTDEKTATSTTRMQKKEL